MSPKWPTLNTGTHWCWCFGNGLTYVQLSLCHAHRRDHLSNHIQDISIQTDVGIDCCDWAWVNSQIQDFPDCYCSAEADRTVTSDRITASVFFWMCLNNEVRRCLAFQSLTSRSVIFGVSDINKENGMLSKLLMFTVYISTDKHWLV